MLSQRAFIALSLFLFGAAVAASEDVVQDTRDFIAAAVKKDIRQTDLPGTGRVKLTSADANGIVAESQGTSLSLPWKALEEKELYRLARGLLQKDNADGYAVVTHLALKLGKGIEMAKALDGLLAESPASADTVKDLYAEIDAAEPKALIPVKAAESPATGEALHSSAQEAAGKNDAVKGDAEGSKLVVDGSIFFPTYIAADTVYTRGVADMPLAPNSAEIAKYMPIEPVKNKDKMITFLAIHVGVPIYIVDSKNPKTPRVTFNCPPFRNPSPTLKSILYSNDIPLPAYAQPSESSDHHMFIYDIGTDIIREYFFVVKEADGTWGASWGSYYEHMSTLAKNNYACQATEGSAFVVGMIGGPGLIGVEEARRGEIRHAVGFLTANARKGVVSWPAKGSDGTDLDPNAPAQGQWFRLRPTLNLDNLNLKPMTLLIAKAVQKYGGFAQDRTLGCHIFTGESGFVEQHKTGKNPWKKGGDLYMKYNLSKYGYDISDFPWHLTEWAPVDWGKPGMSR